MRRRFVQCGVFTSVPTRGNGLAVVIDGEGLSDSAMQQFAAWTNLAETTFLLAPTTQEADYIIRCGYSHRRAKCCLPAIQRLAAAPRGFSVAASPGRRALSGRDETRGDFCEDSETGSMGRPVVDEYDDGYRQWLTESDYKLAATS